MLEEVRSIFLDSCKLVSLKKKKKKESFLLRVVKSEVCSRTSLQWPPGQGIDFPKTKKMAVAERWPSLEVRL